MRNSLNNGEKKSHVGQDATYAELVEAIKNNIHLTDDLQIRQLLKGADITVYSHATLPKLKRNQIWINGGQTKDWYENASATGKQLIFVESLGNITPWLKVTIQEVLKLASDKNPEVFANLIFNLVEQLKNNYSAAEMAKMMKGMNDENSQYYAEVFTMRKKHAQELIDFLRTVIKRKRRFIAKHPELYTSSIPRLGEFEVKFSHL